MTKNIPKKSLNSTETQSQPFPQPEASREPSLVVTFAVYSGDTVVHSSPRGTHVYLVIPEALLDFIEQAAVIQLTECGQVITGSRRRELDLRDGTKARLINVSHFLIRSSWLFVPVSGASWSSETTWV